MSISIALESQMQKNQKLNHRGSRHLPVKKKGILRQALLWQLDRFISYEAVEDLLWGDSDDGGPLYALNIIHILVMELRREGCVLEIWYGVGLRMRSNG